MLHTPYNSSISGTAGSVLSCGSRALGRSHQRLTGTEAQGIFMYHRGKHSVKNTAKITKHGAHKATHQLPNHSFAPKFGTLTKIPWENYLLRFSPQNNQVSMSTCCACGFYLLMKSDSVCPPAVLPFRINVFSMACPVFFAISLAAGSVFRAAAVRAPWQSSGLC